MKKTNRIVTVEQAWPVCSIGSEVCARVALEAFDYLDAPPTKVIGQGRADALCRQSGKAGAAHGR